MNYGDVDQVIVEGRHEPIISKEDFKKVQEIMDSHSKPIKLGRRQALGTPKNIWSKKLICECGSTFNRKIYHKNKNSTTYCYVCYNKKSIPRLDLKLLVMLKKCKNGNWSTWLKLYLEILQEIQKIEKNYLID